ncbi:hypothetical protein GCM10020216_087190 [Nonomuraea helvata]
MRSCGFGDYRPRTPEIRALSCSEGLWPDEGQCQVAAGGGHGDGTGGRVRGDVVAVVGRQDEADAVTLREDVVGGVQAPVDGVRLAGFDGARPREGVAVSDIDGAAVTTGDLFEGLPVAEAGSAGARSAVSGRAEAGGCAGVGP